MALDSRFENTNPIRDRKDWERQRSGAKENPGKFHGEIAKREIFWFHPEINAWIKRIDGKVPWIGFDAVTGLPRDIALPETFEPWAVAFNDSDPPFYKWFEGALTNACFNEVDVHVIEGHGDETAFIFEGDRWDSTLNDGDGGPVIHRSISRKELLCEVVKYALVLRQLGLKKGDRVVLNMPNILEQIYFIEAAKRLGIIYTCVFCGFSSKTLYDRILDSGAKVLITVDGAYRNGQLISFKNQYIDPALNAYNSPIKVLVVRNAQIQECNWVDDRDFWVHELLEEVEKEHSFSASTPTNQLIAKINQIIPPVPVDATYPLFIIYTSGSTGKPKGVVHTHGGYVAGIAHTMRVSFGVNPNATVPEVIYVVADPGWITGQSYMISAALTTRTTSVITEGSPIFPHAGRLSSIIERYKVNIFKAGSTFLKTILSAEKNIEDVKKHDRTTLRVATFCAEPTSPSIQKFAMNLLTECYINSYWATEHGGIVLTHFYGNDDFKLKPDAHTFPLPWIFADVWKSAEPVEIEGQEAFNFQIADFGEKGEIVITHPYPYLMRTLWGDADNVNKPEWKGDSENFLKTYYSHWVRNNERVLSYTQGDYACKYEDGSMTLHGRSDDVINTSGHRIGTEEIEHALLKDKKMHPDTPVKNVLVVGAHHEERGEIPIAFVMTEGGIELSPDVEKRLTNLVRKEKGIVALPGAYITVNQFPETRSGKYIRRFLRQMIEGETIGDISTLKNPESISEIMDRIKRWKEEVKGETGRSDLVSALVRMNEEERGKAIKSYILEVVRELLGIGNEIFIPDEEGFFSLGMDSVNAMELYNRLNRSLKEVCELSSTVTFDYPTVASLAKHIEDKLQEYSTWLYEVKWVKSEKLIKSEVQERGCWVVLSDEEHPIIHLLKQTNQVILIRSGEKYAQVNEETFVVNSDTVDDFITLFEYISPIKKLKGVVYLWGYGDVNESEIEEYHKKHITNLVMLSKSMGSVSELVPTQLNIVTQSIASDGTPTSLASWPLRAFSKVVQEEYPLIRCSYIAMDPEEKPELLVKELINQGGETEVLLRGGERLVPRLVRSKMLKGRTPRLSSDASYLILGGLRPLGIYVAKWYVNHGAKHLILVDEPGFESGIDEVKNLGVDYKIYETSFHDIQDIREILNHINNDLPPLKGVINTLGIVDNDLIIDLNWERFRSNYNLKVLANWHLHMLTEHLPLDHFIMFSSCLADFSPLGRASNVVGNAFLDALTYYRTKRGLPSLTVSWGLWGPSQVVVRRNIIYNMIRQIDVIEIDDANALLERIFYSTNPYVVAAKIKWEHLMRTHRVDNPFYEEIAREMGYKEVNFLEIYSRTPQGERLRVIHEHIIKTLEQLQPLARKVIEVDKTFAEMGFDTFEMVTLKNQIQVDFGKGEVLPSHLFEQSSTIRKLAKALANVLEKMTNKMAPTESKEISKESIAIIGMGCRFPGGGNCPEEFWKLLEKGKDGISQVPSCRWDADSYYDADPQAPGKMITKLGGFLDCDISQFDAAFFGISPREAEFMDPQQRLLLEVSYEAMESAGIAPERMKGSKTGVFVGISTRDYMDLFISTGMKNLINPYMATGNMFSTAAGRISFVFGFKGPNYAIDSACSSSLVAIHEACNSLLTKESNMALAGGVNLIISPNFSIDFSKAGMLAADGHCKTFDASADGYVRGEGCGIIVLKRLSDAIRDGDSVLAVIRASGINQDGATSSLTVPNGESQEALIRNVLEKSGLKGEDIEYVEAHGTGTPLGDPIEVRAIGATYGQRDKSHPIKIGSVKTNIGHLESAAGVAGVIKIILSLQHENIPAHLNFKQINPLINQNFPLEIATKNEPWKRGEAVRRAAVSSFGFSGTNAHMILEESPRVEREHSQVDEMPLHFLTLSARTEPALDALVQKYLYFLGATTSSLADICYTTNIGRNHELYRLVVVVEDLPDLKVKLSQGEFVKRKAIPEKRKEVVTIPSRDDWKYLVNLLTDSYLDGATIDWVSLHAPYSRKIIPLPTYPFQRQSYWIEELKTHTEEIESHHEQQIVSDELGRALESSVNKDQIVNEYLIGRVKNILKLPQEETIDPKQGFFEMGMDSIMAVELKNDIQVALGDRCRISETAPLDYPSVAKLKEYILKELQIDEGKGSEDSIEEEITKYSIDELIDEINGKREESE